MFFGVMMYSFTITALSNIIVKIDKKEKIYNKRVEYLNLIKTKYKLNAGLYKTLNRFLNYDLQINRIDKKSVLNELPPQLKQHLILQIYKNPISNLKIFDNTPNDFRFKSVTMLKQLKMFKDEYIISTGDFIEEIYFIKRGYCRVELVMGKKKVNILEMCI
jgi:hypothetical protein